MPQMRLRTLAQLSLSTLALACDDETTQRLDASAPADASVARDAAPPVDAGFDAATPPTPDR